MRRTEVAVVLLVIALAAGMRLYSLRTTPPGLYPDEAVDGNNAINAWESGHFAVFYPNNNGEEGFYANIVAFSVQAFGNTAFAIRFVSALAGILTVWGTYLLTRRMFDDWEVSGIASFLIAVGFWHVNFSRIGFRAILAPLMAVWAFYYLYKAIETHRLWHWGLAGVFVGLGMHTYIAFRIIPLAILAAFIAYWFAVHRHLGEARHQYTRKQVLGGFALLIGVALIVAMPLIVYFVSNPEYFSSRTTQISVFSDDYPILAMLRNTALTLGMFFFYGDGNWRHNIAGAPILFWPVAALFAVGLLRNIWRFYESWRLRGHPGLPQTLLLSWFFIGLLPTILSNEGLPHALRAIVVAPAVYIMAAQAVHWFLLWMRRQHLSPSVVGLTVVVFLVAIGFADASRYFYDWGGNANTAAEFNERAADIAAQLNALPPSTLKYVATHPEGVLIDGIGVAAQTVMYLTDTATPAKQKKKNIYYLTPEQFAAHRYPRGVVLFQL